MPEYVVPIKPFVPAFLRYFTRRNVFHGGVVFTPPSLEIEKIVRIGAFFNSALGPCPWLLCAGMSG